MEYLAGFAIGCIIILIAIRLLAPDQKVEEPEPFANQELHFQIATLEETAKTYKDAMLSNSSTIETLRTTIEDYEKQLAETKSQVEKEIKLRCKTWMLAEEKKIREDAIKRSKNTIKGKTTEHLLPFFDDFEYNPSDCRFIGSPIDLIIFDGLSEGRVKNVVFVEIKMGKSASLTTRERRVRDAIEAGSVQWKLLRKSD